MKRRQCKHCPFKKGTDPHDIPNGYCETRHENLRGTIAEPGALNLGAALRIMACHETDPGDEMPCVGWLVHQFGPGNNIGLRLAVWAEQISMEVATVGPQHERFEDTLPSGEK